MKEQLTDYDKIAGAIIFIENNCNKRLQLSDIAEHLSLSPYQFQRLFVKWAGVNPEKFFQFITIKYVRKKLNADHNLLEAAYSLGPSSTSRAHDLFVTIQGITPGDYKKKGERLKINYGIFESPFGQFFLASADEKICKLDFYEEIEDAVQELHKEWSQSTIFFNPKPLRPQALTIFQQSKQSPAKFHLLVKGTQFQLKVWEALLKIPECSLVSYGRVANAIGMPGASRAVGSAIGKNPVGYLIPCHRVIKKNGEIGGYRGGNIRKTAMIGWEAGKNSTLLQKERNTEAYPGKATTQ